MKKSGPRPPPERAQIQALRRENQALLASLAFQTELLDAIPTPIFYKDRAGRYQSVNRAFIELFGGTKSDLIGKTADESWPLEAADTVCAWDQALFQDPGVQVDETQITNRRGERRDLVFHKATVHAPDGGLHGLIGFVLDMTERRRTEEALRVSLAELERHDAQLLALNGMVELLLSCETRMQAYAIIARAAARLFAGYNGALAVPGEDGAPDQRVVARWGDLDALPLSVPLGQCRALRSGQFHEVMVPSQGGVCRHFADPLPPPHLCIPLTVRNETLGLLHLSAPAALTAGGFADLRTLAIAVSEAIKLTLSNLRMQETLREQVIRDPLTGLFNRRYLDEALPREMALSRRRGEPLAVAMLDLDHFKRFNDAYGHEAGDAVLRAVGALLSCTLRAGDLACRYGGEELTLILPGASLDAARGRLDGLRTAITQQRLRYQGADLPPITVSIGVTVAGARETDAVAVLKRADAALYRAKEAGRNRVVAVEP